jgi:hypothetical protein
VTFTFPEEIDGEPPEQFRNCYEPSRYDASRFRLTEAAREYIADRETELSALEAQAAQDLAAERQAHEQTKQELRATIIAQALNKALVAAGADPRRKHGAVALLMSIWNFSVDGDDVSVCSANGDELDLAETISIWLTSDAGEAFATRRPPTAATLTRIKSITRITR